MKTEKRFKSKSRRVINLERERWREKHTLKRSENSRRLHGREIR